MEGARIPSVLAPDESKKLWVYVCGRLLVALTLNNSPTPTPHDRSHIALWFSLDYPLHVPGLARASIRTAWLMVAALTTCKPQ